MFCKCFILCNHGLTCRTAGRNDTTVRFSVLDLVSECGRGRNTAGVCKTQSSDDHFRSSAFRRILGGRVSRPETTRWVARQVASFTGARQLCNQWSNHGALNSEITPKRNETLPRVHHQYREGPTRRWQRLWIATVLLYYTGWLKNFPLDKIMQFLDNR